MTRFAICNSDYGIFEMYEIVEFDDLIEAKGYANVYAVNVGQPVEVWELRYTATPEVDDEGEPFIVDFWEEG